MEALSTTDHVRERFYRAAKALATMKESRHKRVAMAATILSAFGEHDTGRLPEDLQATFERLRQIDVNKLTSTTAKRLAEEIFDFYVALRGGI
jgi:N-glycosylase/DNA lyase